MRRSSTAIKPEIATKVNRQATPLNATPYPLRMREEADHGGTRDLARKLRKYIRVYATSAKPFRGTYTDPERRIKVSQ
jgi:hypothetical protein